MEVYGTGTGSLVPVRMYFLRCLLDDGLRGEGLGIPSPFLGCHCSSCRGKSDSGECGLLPGTVRGGRHGVVWLLLVVGWRTWWWECRLLSGPSFSVMDVPVIIQLVFLQSYENVEVPQIPFLTECSRFQLYYRGESVQCKMCKSQRFHCAFLGKVVDVPVVIQRQVLGVGQCRKTVEVPQLQSVQFLEVIDTPVVLVTTFACGPDSAEIRRAFAVLDKAVGMPLVCRNCGGSAVTVRRQVWFTCLSLCNDWCRWSRQCRS